ncbi:hypothetical protein DMH15_02295 [Streptomyces sp. WAC 06725]|nr:hypothetical protein DMH15_02295 [Streptomyces sp. WAC 06725]
MSDSVTLSACLKRLSWSPDRLAREINRVCGGGTISDKAPYNWLKGSLPRRQLPEIVARILSEKLGEPVTVRDLWPDRFPAPVAEKAALVRQRSAGTAPDPLPAQDMVATAVDWLVGNDPPMTCRLRGEEVDPHILSVLEDRSAQLRRLGDERAGELVMDWAVQELRWTRKLIAECSYGRATGLRLHRTAAELAQVVGWMAADLDMAGQSERHLLAALRSARIAGDRALAAYVISCLSYRFTWSGQGREALRLIQIARKGTQDEAPGPGQALLASRLARAYAALGDAVGCRRALDEAQELIEADGECRTAPWASWVTPAVLVADAGRSWLDVGRSAWAERHLVRGLELFGESQPLNRLLHWTSLAEARLAHGDVDGAAAATWEALGLWERVTSHRARVRLTRLRSRFARCDAMVARQIAQDTAEVLDEARRLASCG